MDNSRFTVQINSVLNQINQTKAFLFEGNLDLALQTMDKDQDVSGNQEENPRFFKQFVGSLMEVLNSKKVPVEHFLSQFHVSTYTEFLLKDYFISQLKTIISGMIKKSDPL